MTGNRLVEWARAFSTSAVMTYFPFVVMATYVLLFVSCPHCKQAAWWTMPTAPGLISGLMICRLTGLCSFSDSLVTVTTVTATFAFIAIPMAAYRRLDWTSLSMGFMQLLVSAIQAVFLLAMIQA